MIIRRSWDGSGTVPVQFGYRAVTVRVRARVRVAHEVPSTSSSTGSSETFCAWIPRLRSWTVA